jgi:hypothetical protein
MPSAFKEWLTRSGKTRWSFLSATVEPHSSGGTTRAIYRAWIIWLRLCEWPNVFLKYLSGYPLGSWESYEVFNDWPSLSRKTYACASPPPWWMDRRPRRFRTLLESLPMGVRLVLPGNREISVEPAGLAGTPRYRMYRTGAIDGDLVWFAHGAWRDAKQILSCQCEECGALHADAVIERLTRDAN